MADPEVKVTELLNEAALTTEGPRKVKILAELKELLLHRAPELCDKYFEDVLAFQNDPTPDVRKSALGIFEDACQKHATYLRTVVPALQNIVFNDSNANVLKKAIQVASGLLKMCLKWVSTAPPGSAEARDAAAAWDTLCKLRDYLVKQIDSDNDGIRTHAIKFMEAVILAQTFSNDASGNEVCLNIVPRNLNIVRPKKLEEEAKKVLESLLKFHSSIHISSVNLMATMAALTNIAKQRLVFLPVVIQAMQGLNSNLPPTLGKSQVSSVRKMMKVHMMALLKLPAAVDSLPEITALLTELGASYNEIMKNHPNPEEVRLEAKRKKDEAARKRGRGGDFDLFLPNQEGDGVGVGVRAGDPRAKRPRRAEYDPEYPRLPGMGRGDEAASATSSSSRGAASSGAASRNGAGQLPLLGGSGPASSATALPSFPSAGAGADRSSRSLAQLENLGDSAEAYISTRLRPEVAVGLIMDAMLRLPAQMPANFAESYVPLSAPGTNKQIRLVSRILGTKMIESDLFPYDKTVIERRRRELEERQKEKARAEEEERRRLERERKEEREKEKEKVRLAEAESQQRQKERAEKEKEKRDAVKEPPPPPPPEVAVADKDKETAQAVPQPTQPEAAKKPTETEKPPEVVPDKQKAAPAPAKPAASGVSTLALKQKRITNERLSDKTKALSPQIVAKIRSAALARIASFSTVYVESELPVVGRAEARREAMKLAQGDVMAGLSSLMSAEDAIKWVVDFFGDDPVGRIEMILSVLYQEYGQVQKFSPVSAVVLRGPTQFGPAPEESERYGIILASALKIVIGLSDFPEKYAVIRRLYLETPSLTDAAVDLIAGMLPSFEADEDEEEEAEPKDEPAVGGFGGNNMIVPTTNLAKSEADAEREARVTRVCELLGDLVTYRPGSGRNLTCLRLLLDLAVSHPKKTVRSISMESVMNLASVAEEPEFATVIAEHAISCLRSLALPHPPENMVTKFKRFGGTVSGEVVVKSEPMEEGGEGEGGAAPVVQNGEVTAPPGENVPISAAPWSEEFVKLACGLVFALLPLKPELLFDLVEVFVEATPDVKRVILRLLEEPVRKLDPGAPQIMVMLDRFPKGGETFISRMIHILTEKAYPNQALVDKMKELYKTKVSDVRFLIPVITCLTKADIVEALPKLIRLAPAVVREVFNRLLGVSGVPEGETFKSPVSPVDLMVELHKIPATASDVKSVIKGTSTCFAMTDVYTMEVLSMLLQALVDLPEIPTLMMRTVIQAYALHPKLSAYVMNTLQQLIRKEVWRYPRIWEGFIKCCQRGGSQCCGVLLQLPAEHLKDVFKEAPELKDVVTRHVDAFANDHKAFVPRSLLEVIYGVNIPREMEGLEPPPPGAMEAEGFGMPSTMNIHPTIMSGKPEFDGFRS